MRGTEPNTGVRCIPSVKIPGSLAIPVRAPSSSNSGGSPSNLIPSSRGPRPPDDPTLRDWATRSMAHAKDLTPNRRKLALQQHGRCRQCGESLFKGEALHVHHKLPRAQGGTDTYANLELLHATCHRQHHGRLLKRMPGRYKSPRPLENARGLLEAGARQWPARF